jgi:hypothetical protein
MYRPRALQAVNLKARDLYKDINEIGRLILKRFLKKQEAAAIAQSVRQWAGWWRISSEVKRPGPLTSIY